MPYMFMFKPVMVQTRVSNGTGFSCPTGQRDRCPLIVTGQRRQLDKDFLCPGTKGQWDQLKIVPGDRRKRAGIF